MRVLVACEFSGIVRDAFAAKGHDAMSCDLIETERPGKHHVGDVLELLERESFDLMIAHPPCTYLSLAGNVWINQPGRKEKREAALEFFIKLANAKVNMIAIENPKGYPCRAYRKPEQVIQPFEYGHPAHKPTCLWLKNLPPLRPTNVVEVESKFDGKRTRHWVDRVGGGSASGKKNRSRTFHGIADAMADQWGNYTAKRRRAMEGL